MGSCTDLLIAINMSDVMFVRFSDLGVPDPAGWRRSHSKVYDYNTNAGSFYYQPMLEYIERKGIMGLDQSLAIQKSAAASRTTVELANCVDFARRTRDDVPSVALRLGNFLDVYRARQIKQRNIRTVHVKNELVRGSKNPETIKDRRTSGMVRDRYLDQLGIMHQSGVGKLPTVSEDQYF